MLAKTHTRFQYYMSHGIGSMYATVTQLEQCHATTIWVSQPGWWCCRSAIAAALTSWWANEFPDNDTTSASVSNFGAVDAFPFTIIQPTDIIVINATFVANISSGTPGSFTYVSQAWIGIQGNTSAFATNLGSGSSGRRLLESSSPSVESTGRIDRSLSMLPDHHISGGDNFAHRSLLQTAAEDISALETKLLGLAASFRGASPCNNTELARAYYNGSSPILDGDRQFYCVNFTVGNNDNIDTYLTSNSASWASLPLFHILVMNNNPVIVRQTPTVDVDSILAANVQYQLQQSQALQAGWQQQLRCVNATVSNRLQLHQLAALVQASLAVEGQMAEAEGLFDLYEQLLSRSADTDTPLLNDQERRLALQLSGKGAPVRLLCSLCTMFCNSEVIYHSGICLIPLQATDSHVKCAGTAVWLTCCNCRVEDSLLSAVKDDTAGVQHLLQQGPPPGQVLLLCECLPINCTLDTCSFLHPYVHCLSFLSVNHPSSWSFHVFRRSNHPPLDLQVHSSGSGPS